MAKQNHVDTTNTRTNKMTTRIIESASNIATRNPQFAPLPSGVYHNDPIHGLIVDYFAETDIAPPGCLYACKYNGSEFIVLQEKASNLEFSHQYLGWPAL
jgi:hypothetical protein